MDLTDVILPSHRKEPRQKMSKDRLADPNIALRSHQRDLWTVALLLNGMRAGLLSKDAANILHCHSKPVTQSATGAAPTRRSHDVFFLGAILDGMFCGSETLCLDVS